MKRLLATTLVVLVFSVPTLATTVTYGWEDGGTILGQFGDLTATNVTAPDPVYAGEHSLHVLDGAASGTPQAFVAWITGLTDGDVIDACFWRYDTTPGASPSCRIWGHYTPVGGTIDDYAGSAGGNDDYGPGEGWDEVCHSWTFDSDTGARDGLIVEVRTYSSAGDEVWLDDLTVTAPDGTTITVPLVTPVAECTWSAIKALYASE